MAHSALAERMTLGEPRNPLDLTGQSVVDHGLLPAALDAMGNDPGLDVLVHGMLIGPEAIIDKQMDSLVAQAQQGTPVAVYSAPGWHPVDYPKLAEAGIPVFNSPDRLFRCLGEWENRRPLAAGRRAEGLGRMRPWTTCWADISAPAWTPAEYAEDRPAAVKLLGDGLDHKSDLGLVELNVEPGDICGRRGRGWKPAARSWACRTPWWWLSPWPIPASS